MPFPSYRKILSLVQNGQVREAKRGMMVSLNEQVQAVVEKCDAVT
jgi:hypothetical protein